MRPPDPGVPPPDDAGNVARPGAHHDLGRVGRQRTAWDSGLARTERSALEVVRCTTLALDAVLGLAADSILEGRPLELDLLVGALDRLCQRQAAAVAYLTALAAEAAA